MIWPSQSWKSKDLPWFSFFYYDKNKSWSHIKNIYKSDMKNPHAAIFMILTGCGKGRLALGLIERKYKKDFIASLLYTQHSTGIRHIMIRVGSYMMKMFGLWNQRTSYINAKIIFHYHSQAQKQYLPSIICNETLDKRRQSLLELIISSEHCNYYWWCFTQSFKLYQGI